MTVDVPVEERAHSRSRSGDSDQDILAGPRCHLHFNRKKIDFLATLSACCCELALPRSTHLIFYFTTSDTRPSRLDCMRNILGPAAREPASTVGCVYVWIPSWILWDEPAVCSLLCEDGVQAGLNAGSICQRLRRIMQASVMNDLVPGFRFPEDFCGFPTTLLQLFSHTAGFVFAASSYPEMEAPSQQVL